MARSKARDGGLITDQVDTSMEGVEMRGGLLLGVILGRPYWRVFLATIVVLLAGLSCANGEPMTRSSQPPGWRDVGQLPSREIPLAEGEDYKGLAWLPGDILVVAHNPTAWQEGEPNRGGDLWTVPVEGSALTQLPLPSDQKGCSVTDYGGPRALPDGRLGFTKWCALGLYEDRYWAMAWDPKADETEVLVGPVHDPIGAPSWNPSMEEAVFGRGSYICGGIAWLSSEGIQLSGITVQVGETSWRVDDYFRVGDNECDVEGQADWPVWSPEGSLIAFFGMPPTPGRGGFSRLDQPWSLFIMDSSRREPRQVLRGIVAPNGLEWSPDGRRLAFAGKISGTDGLWLLSLEEKRLNRLLAFQGAFAWSPDGGRMAILSDDGLGTPDSPHRARLRIVYLGSFLKGADPHV